MSITALNWAFSNHLPPNEKLLLISMGDYADDDGYLFAGQKKLAEKTSMSIATVRRLTGKLRDRGLLETESRRSPETGYKSSDGTRLIMSPLNLSAEDSHRSDSGSQRSTVSATGEPPVEPPVERSAGAKKHQPKTPRLLPDDWQPTEKHRSQHPRLDVDREALRFRNHAAAHQRKVVMWDAAFANWLLKAEENRDPGTGGISTIGHTGPPTTGGFSTHLGSTPSQRVIDIMSIPDPRSIL